MTRLTEGSIWRRFDPHVHTPASYQHSFTPGDAGISVWDRYIDELEKIHDVDAIGITDYFCIEGYKQILEYRKLGRLQNFKLIFPNIELRLNILYDDKRLEYHVVFSDTISPEAIDQEFLHALDITTGDGEKRKLTLENIVSIGGKLKDQDARFAELTPFEAGCQNIYVDVDQIDQLLNTKSIFRAHYLSIIPASSISKIRWEGQGHLTRKHLTGC